MSMRLRILFMRLLRLNRSPGGFVSPRRGANEGLSTYQKTLAMHIAATTQSAGRGWAR